MRHIPEAGAVCGNSARTDLCGGRGVTSVPTATVLLHYTSRQPNTQRALGAATAASGALGT